MVKRLSILCKVCNLSIRLYLSIVCDMYFFYFLFHAQVLGAADALPEIYTELEISYFLLRRLLGVRTEGDKKAAN